jgi:hypothetical protein
MKELPNILKVSPTQIAFGRRLGLELAGCTVSVARAKIEDLVDHGFNDADLSRPTEKQVALARKFGYDISGETRRVGDAILDDIMEQLNHDSIVAQKLEAGVAVTRVRDTTRRKHIISSIYPDGTVYFKGGNGQKAWARNVHRINHEA